MKMAKNRRKENGKKVREQLRRQQEILENEKIVQATAKEHTQRKKRK